MILTGEYHTLVTRQIFSKENLVKISANKDSFENNKFIDKNDNNKILYPLATQMMAGINAYVYTNYKSKSVEEDLYFDMESSFWKYNEPGVIQMSSRVEDARCALVVTVTKQKTIYQWMNSIGEKDNPEFSTRDVLNAGRGKATIFRSDEFIEKSNIEVPVMTDGIGTNYAKVTKAFRVTNDITSSNHPYHIKPNN